MEVLGFEPEITGIERDQLWHLKVLEYVYYKFFYVYFMVNYWVHILGFILWLIIELF